jgi:hypothetical protein
MRNVQASNVALLCLGLAITVSGAAGCGDDTGGGGSTGVTTGTTTSGTGGAGGAAAGEYGALIRGTLADPATAQADHDMLAMGGESAAKAAGDFGHDALLGSGLLMSTTVDDFLGIDRWDNADGMNAFYSDPMFAAAFGALFNPPPTLETFQYQPDWYGWGDMRSGDASDPYFFVIVRGRLAGDPADIKPQHDAVAMGGETQAMAAGDVAHVVYLGLQDTREFWAVDIWNADDNIEAFYTDPMFQMAFAPLFEGGTATIQVYQSTDWHQW